MSRRRSYQPLAYLLGIGLILQTAACGINSARKNYVFAEKLWEDGKYSAAVVEFEKVAAKDPQGKLGQQALFRAAMTQAFFLSKYEDAVRKFRVYIEMNKGQPGVWEVEKLIGDIFFSKVELYDQAIQQYQMLLKQKEDTPDAPEFLFRIGKSQFYLTHFQDAETTYKQIMKLYPDSLWAEKAELEVAVTYFTRGDQLRGGKDTGKESYQEAIDLYQQFIRKHPKSEAIVQAKFGIASCLEELDQLEAAYHAYSDLLSTYPDQNVIRIKMARLNNRRTHRRR